MPTGTPASLRTAIQRLLDFASARNTTILSDAEQSELFALEAQALRQGKDLGIALQKPDHRPDPSLIPTDTGLLLDRRRANGGAALVTHHPWLFAVRQWLARAEAAAGSDGTSGPVSIAPNEAACLCAALKRLLSERPIAFSRWPLDGKSAKAVADEVWAKMRLLAHAALPPVPPLPENLDARTSWPAVAQAAKDWIIASLETLKFAEQLRPNAGNEEKGTIWVGSFGHKAGALLQQELDEAKRLRREQAELAAREARAHELYRQWQGKLNDLFDAVHRFGNEEKAAGRKPDEAGYLRLAKRFMAIGQAIGELNGVRFRNDDERYGELLKAKLGNWCQAGVPSFDTACMILIEATGCKAESLANLLAQVNEDPNRRNYILWMPFLCDHLWGEGKDRISMPPSDVITHAELERVLRRVGYGKPSLVFGVQEDEEELPGAPLDAWGPEWKSLEEVVPGAVTNEELENPDSHESLVEHCQGILEAIRRQPCPGDWQLMVKRLWTGADRLPRRPGPIPMPQRPVGPLDAEQAELAVRSLRTWAEQFLPGKLASWTAADNSQPTTPGREFSAAASPSWTAARNSAKSEAETLGNGKKRRKKHRRTGERKPHPITARQTEALDMLRECKGNFAAAGKRMGISGAAVRKLADKAYGKVAATASKQSMKQLRLPQDARGQEVVTRDKLQAQRRRHGNPVS